jgi:spermidine/putrescine transport system substrate-binding protein
MTDQHPNDPELEAAIAMARSMSRRRFLTRSGLALGGLAMGPQLLAACSSSKGTSTSGTTIASGTGDKLVKISNWDAYIDQVNGSETAKGTTIYNFQKATGVQVIYKKDFNDNNEYFNKVFEPNLGRGKPIYPDIAVPTYWMAARLIGLNQPAPWVQPLPLDQIPNHANLVAYDPKKTGFEIKSFNDIFDPRLQGKVGFLTELHDSVGLTMLGMGLDPSKPDFEGANKALDKIDAAKKAGKILKFTGNEYLRSLQNGDFLACLAWSGDIVQLNRDSPGFKFLIPEQGGMSWFDTMIIPNYASNVPAAAKWINYVYDPAHAAQITNYVQYISPVQGVQDELVKLGGDAAKLAESPILFPSAEEKKRLYVFAPLPDTQTIALQKRFDAISG